MRFDMVFGLCISSKYSVGGSPSKFDKNVLVVLVQSTWYWWTIYIFQTFLTSSERISKLSYKSCN